MEKRIYKTKEEVLNDLFKAQDDLYDDMKNTDGLFIEKSKLDKIYELNKLYKIFKEKE